MNIHGGKSNMMKKIAGIVLSLLVLSVLVPGVQAAGLKVGDAMTEFSLKGESGKEYNLESLKGKKVVFVFTQSACSACRGEIVLLNDLAKEAKNVLFMPVSVDMGGAKVLERYKKDYKIGFDFLLDPEFKFPRRFGFSYTPSTVLIGSDGKIVGLIGGYDDEAIKKIKEFVK
jgi:peroxiredoxin